MIIKYTVYKMITTYIIYNMIIKYIVHDNIQKFNASKTSQNPYLICFRLYSRV